MTDKAATATIRDVALRAGVSTATVSRVLAGVGNPRPDIAAAVMAAAGAFEYRPSGVARSLRMKRTRTLGLIITDIQNPFFPELVQAARPRRAAPPETIRLPMVLRERESTGPARARL